MSDPFSPFDEAITPQSPLPPAEKPPPEPSLGPYVFPEAEIAAAEPVFVAHEPDTFERMVAGLRRLTGYDPGGEDEWLDELAAARTRRWAGRVVLFATLTLAVLNAKSLQTWSDTLPPSWATETIHQIADTWSERLGVLGLNGPRDAIHGGYEKLKGSQPLR